MPLIDYEAYLDGDQWPSESKRAVVGPGGHVEPDLVPVYDMPPQYAVAALHKLIRWAYDSALSVEHAEQEETRVRGSHLGRLLARKALSIEDFELYAEHGVSREPLSPRDIAYELATQMLGQTKGTLSARLAPEEIGHLASAVASGMTDEGYVVFKEDG